MIPLSVSLPVVVSIDSVSIILKWNKPTSDQLKNGALTSYIVYLNNTNSSLKINNIDCSTTIQALENLIPGTEYSIVLSACTNGGCTNSSVLKVTTLESLPDEKDLILSVAYKNATSIYLKWREPSRPNGKIQKYILYMLGKQIYEGKYSK
jgi:usherin